MHSAEVPPQIVKAVRREMNFEQGWEKLKSDTLTPLIKGEIVDRETWQNSITDVNALINGGHLDRLHYSVAQLLKTFVGEIYSRLRDACADDVDKPIEECRLIQDYNREWRHFSIATQYFTRVLCHVDREVDRTQGPSNLPIRKVAIAQWKEGCVRPLEKTLVSKALSIVAYDRRPSAQNAPPTHELMKECGEFANSLIRLNSSDVDEASGSATRGSRRRTHIARDSVEAIKRQFYEEVFEARFLEESRHHYQQVDSENAGEDSTDYVRAVSLIAVKERLRAQHHLPATTEPKIVGLCEEEFVVKHLDRFTQALDFYLDEDLKEDAERTYVTLASCKQAVDCVSREFGHRVKKSGIQAVVPILRPVPADPTRFIDAVLNEHEQFHSILSAAFHDDPQISAEMDKALGETVNHSEVGQTPKAAELLVRSLDAMLRDEKKRRSTSSTGGDVEVQLARVLIVFRYLQDKDLFLKLYWKRAATRLLSKPSGASHDLEKTVVCELKNVAGYEFTNRLASMLQDLETSSTLADKYREKIAEHGSKSTEVNVRVLKSVNWPLPRLPFCTLPPSVLESYQRFEEFYRRLHNGRVLKYDSVWGTAELKASFYGSGEVEGAPTTTKTLIVPTPLMSILTQFNQRRSATFDELLHATNIAERDLKRHLQAVSAPDKPKQMILHREGSGVEIAGNDVFSINEYFTSEQSRVKIQVGPALQQQQQAQQAGDERETIEKLEGSRRYETEAAIVRVMKARQVLQHNVLVAEVTRQLANRFKPDPSRIKSCIESLITREYLRRGDVDLGEYRYVA